MKRILVATLSLGLGLAGLSGVATAQEIVPGTISTNADGSYVTSTAGVNPTANGGGGTIAYGDITTGPGYTVIGPPSVVQSDPVPVAAPVSEPSPVEPVPADTAAAPESGTGAVATAADQDADNMADELEWDLGLDPANPDSDADGVADGDEINIYLTDPVAPDTDGDGLTDGQELFATETDPLVWDDASVEPVESIAQQATSESQQFEGGEPVRPVQPLAQGTTEVLTATDGDAAALGAGNASAAPGTVTRDGGSGMSLLGPDGTYSVTENAPSNVTIEGDTEVLSPPLEAAPAATDAATAPSYAPTCSSYGSWYDAQVAYENAGMTAADPALVSALDPDYDGIACEEGMQ